jgi:hypothetical protein
MSAGLRADAEIPITAMPSLPNRRDLDLPARYADLPGHYETGALTAPRPGDEQARSNQLARRPAARRRFRRLCRAAAWGSELSRRNGDPRNHGSRRSGSR